MQQPIGLLSDNINYVQPLLRAMYAAGVPSPFPIYRSRNLTDVPILK